ncbi:6,7-dimethyl-8-ribityllumazine synthase [Bartonella bacilliformis str. Heidi Mejia]|uniref:6,7-dimethyl-8-ribityllumazine synthase n=3 Tax=Bartonella bacilliformis TaxID=774 RepID=RISB_BARBK|nr:6,7-dimethyl-8-ribityllumazine synthase [Bartonella bacilliformis]A1USI4.1 RecName: Full=6,7-dimethyl-8-ribityllumazine synthase; Short=DMRL synthase; Short=LS; Short=Lumazine synthase [Bartonella bacilliformis KC583]ABM44740.1 6,7-dimethyl-8-ribityllumazine synthase [Bartonella bacilliformis KC583]AMG85755.1 6,7-dimethyl-8-ribityllumazine synthase [Bartonella bacilliformis]EKS44540.1 6,7-dimethyl-8-ribityllumazine synthase [Bartonella bacilliformis INS]EYS89822.1 6,7-dimethyl-8-ribitylluma
MTQKLHINPHLLIVEARFYNEISDELLAGAVSVLQKSGVSYDIITVPGALEIPAAIAFAEKDKTVFYDGYVALGCVIRGETYHFEIVADNSCRALMDLTVHQQLAIGNGILTVENEKQAWARAKQGEKNKGDFAAEAALCMIALKKRFGDNR